MSRNQLAKHVKKCTGELAGRNCQSKAALLRPISPTVSQTFREKVVLGMQTDDIYQLLTNDRLSMKVAERYWARNKDLGERGVKRTRDIMRQLGRLLQAVKRVDPFQCRSMEECVGHPDNYEKLVEATKELTCFHEDTNEVDGPQLAPNMGLLISQLPDIRKREFGAKMKLGKR